MKIPCFLLPLLLSLATNFTSNCCQTKDAVGIKKRTVQREMDGDVSKVQRKFRRRINGVKNSVWQDLEGGRARTVRKELAESHAPAESKDIDHVSEHSETKILSAPVDDYGYATVKENVLSLEISVDEGRELVFMSTWGPQHGLSKMTIRGEHYQSVVTFRNEYTRPLSVVVDPTNQKVFVSNQFFVQMIYYDGSGRHDIVSSISHYGLALDLQSNSLFYTGPREIKKYDLDTETSSLLTELSQQAISMVYTDSVL